MHHFQLTASKFAAITILWTAKQEDCQADCGKIKETESRIQYRSQVCQTGCNLPQTADRQQFVQENRKDRFFPHSSSSGWQEHVENGRRGQGKTSSYFKEITHTQSHTIGFRLS